jgi:hypothetical protein
VSQHYSDAARIRKAVMYTYCEDCGTERTTVHPHAKGSSMSKHTPGPWEAEGTAIYADKVKLAQCLDIDAEELYGDEIMPLPEWRELMVQYEEASENARLIAAAPDLLAAAEAANREMFEKNSVHPLAQRLRAAIARARGEE